MNCGSADFISWSPLLARLPPPPPHFELILTLRVFKFDGQDNSVPYFKVALLKTLYFILVQRDDVCVHVHLSMFNLRVYMPKSLAFFFVIDCTRVILLPPFVSLTDPFFPLYSPPPALPPKKRQSAPSPTPVAVVAPMSRGSSLPCSDHRQVRD